MQPPSSDPYRVVIAALEGAQADGRDEVAAGQPDGGGPAAGIHHVTARSVALTSSTAPAQPSPLTKARISGDQVVKFRSSQPSYLHDPP